MPHSLTAFYNPEISQTRREVGYEKFPQILQTFGIKTSYRATVARNANNSASA